MVKTNFPKEDLINLGLPQDAIEDEIIDIGRWSVYRKIVFQKDGRFYQAFYSHGATETQWEEPWEYEDFVECFEVHKVEKTVEVWEPL